MSTYKAYHTAIIPLPTSLSGFQSTGISFFNTEIVCEENFLVSSVTDRPLSNETRPKEDFSVLSTSSSYNITFMETLVETEQPNNSKLTLIYSYPKASAVKAHV